jgi:hypothetical protein
LSKGDPLHFTVSHRSRCFTGDGLPLLPTQSDLIAAAVGASLETIREWKPKSDDKVGERIAELFDFAFPEMFRHEGALRAALLVSLQQWALERHSRIKWKKAGPW